MSRILHAAFGVLHVSVERYRTATQRCERTLWDKLALRCACQGVSVSVCTFDWDLTEKMYIFHIRDLSTDYINLAQTRRTIESSRSYYIENFRQTFYHNSVCETFDSKNRSAEKFRMISYDTWNIRLTFLAANISTFYVSKSWKVRSVLLRHIQKVTGNKGESR